jgi:Gas vesicle synthesis protein GvpL/GvpF
VSDLDRVVYVYGVVRASEKPTVGLAGVGPEGNPVRHVASSKVAAIVSDVGRVPLGRGRDIRAHWRVLDDAVSRATVLPLRFGTVMESDVAVRDDFLTPNEARLSARLTGLDGKVQMNVRGSYREEVLMRDVVDHSPAVRRLRARIQKLPKAAAYYDMIRLGELVAAEIERRSERDTGLALARLYELAVDSHIEGQTTKESGVNVAFLVERGRVDGFTAAVRRLQDEFGEAMRLRCVGPLPPYSFADDNVGEVAWA